MAARGASRYRQLLRKGYRFEPFDMDRFQDELGKLHGILSESFRRFLGITPISAEDFTNLWAHARYAFDPSLFTFVSSPDDKLAGFAGAFLDLGDPLRTMRGKDHSLARMRFSVSRSLVDRILFYLGGMTPEEEAKGSGLGRAGCSYILKGGCRRKWVRRTVPYGRFWLL